MRRTAHPGPLKLAPPHRRHRSRHFTSCLDADTRPSEGFSQIETPTLSSIRNQNQLAIQPRLEVVNDRRAGPGSGAGPGPDLARGSRSAPRHGCDDKNCSIPEGWDRRCARSLPRDGARRVVPEVTCRSRQTVGFAPRRGCTSRTGAAQPARIAGSRDCPSTRLATGRTDSCQFAVPCRSTPCAIRPEHSGDLGRVVRRLDEPVYVTWPPESLTRCRRVVHDWKPHGAAELGFDTSAGRPRSGSGSPRGLRRGRLACASRCSAVPAPLILHRTM